MTGTDLSRALWRKSQRSNDGGNCVEIADLGYSIAVRDSKDPDGPALTLTPAAWRAFTRHVKEAKFDGS